MNEKISEKELHFRRIEEKERMIFYNYAFESTRGFADSLGISFEFLEKFCRINRLLFGLPAKIFMRNTKDYFGMLNDVIVSGYSLVFQNKENQYILGNVFTRPEFQRRGIGNAIMKKVLEETNGQKIILDVNSKNTPAISLYRKFGFKEVSTTKEFLIDLPFNPKHLPVGYSTRLMTKEDLKKLNDFEKKIPNLKDLKKSYKKSLDKKESKRFRINFQLPIILEQNDKFAGVGRALWSKGTPTTAQIFMTAILPECKEAYPGFLGTLSSELEKYGIKKIVWDTNEKTKPFEDQILPYLGEPARIALRMEINGETK
ncbi:MAG: GNAT family N-acetyltransferase [Candidatus Thorarchaeota archaeon]